MLVAKGLFFANFCKIYPKTTDCSALWPPFESAAEFLIILDLIQQSFVSSRTKDSKSPYPLIALTS